MFNVDRDEMTEEKVVNYAFDVYGEDDNFVVTFVEGWRFGRDPRTYVKRQENQS